MKRSILTTACILALGSLVLASPAIANTGSVFGGWSEDGGYYSLAATTRASTPVHTGRAENSENAAGTSIKRAHGWTTWAGVYHYTRARLEHTCIFQGGTPIVDSGRVWGLNGTEAISPWATFNPNACCGNLGTAKTYYGK